MQLSRLSTEDTKKLAIFLVIAVLMASALFMLANIIGNLFEALCLAIGAGVGLLKWLQGSHPAEHPTQPEPDMTQADLVNNHLVFIARVFPLIPDDKPFELDGHPVTTGNIKQFMYDNWPESDKLHLPATADMVGRWMGVIRQMREQGLLGSKAETQVEVQQ